MGFDDIDIDGALTVAAYADPTYAEVALSELNAYGSLHYVMGWDNFNELTPEDNYERGDLMYALDFKVFEDEDGEVAVAVHAVVNSDSGGYIDTLQEQVYVGDSLDNAKNFAEHYADELLEAAMVNDVSLTNVELREMEGTVKAWAIDVNEAIDIALKEQEG